ncbi:M56 family metallopeptidase [Prosthecobacter sp.]|uniref:M56 family metallopeptidase n=1 Tax=Prosthecobacter sp. TaxID=1965333 RepID=UPI003783FEC2
MNSLTQPIEPWLQSLMLLTWKGTLLTLVVGLVLLLIRRHLSAAWRHGLWLLVLLRFTVPDLGHFSFSLNGPADVPAVIEPAAATAPVEMAMVEVPAEVPAVSQAETPVEMTSATRPTVQQQAPVAAAPAWSLRQMLGLLWLGGAAAVFGVMAGLHVRLQRGIRKDASEAFSEVSGLLDEACRLAGVRHAPRLMVTDAVRAPSLFGVLRPVILLPRQVAAGRDAAALKLILLHELAHLKRHDLWAQILASIVIALHWFNPMVWIAARRLRAEAEMAADAHALSCTNATEAHRFGEVLLGFTRYATTGWMTWLTSATLLGISENKRDLRLRIEGLMDIARGRRTRWVMGLGAFVVLAVIGLTSSPAEEAKKVVAKAADESATTVVTGIVVDEEGKAVKDAKVRLSINMVSRGDSKEQTTGEDGKFRFEEVSKSASLNLRAEHAAFGESSREVFQGVSEGRERRLVLPKILWIVGKITDKRDGRPIKDARVFAGVENKFNIVSRFEWKQPFAHTNEAGEYRLAVKVRDQKGLIVRAWAPDMASQSKVIDLTARETSFDAALEPVVRIPGKVVNFEGEAVKEAMVWVVEDAVWMNESTRPITPELMRSSDRVKMTAGNFFISLAYSEGDGAISLPDVDPLLKDKLWVVAMHPKAGFARMQARDLKPGVVFKLERWATLSGRIIRNDGSPLAEATVRIHAQGSPDLVSSPDVLKVRHSVKITTDKNGGYKIDRLLPGGNFSGVTVSGAGIKTEYLPTTLVTLGSGPQASQQLTLGTSMIARMEGGVRAVQGRIVLPEGQAYRSDDHYIHLSISRDGATIPSIPRPDQEGRFITEMLPTGDYELSVTISPKDARMGLPRDAGRWMRFQVAAGDPSTTLRLKDIVLDNEDLTPKPRAEIAPRSSQPAVFIEGPNGLAEVTTTDGDKKPLPGVKIEVLDFVDHAHLAMGMDKAIVTTVTATSDENGKAKLTFPRVPVPGRRAAGVQIICTAKDGAKSRMTELMDGRKTEIRIFPETAVDITIADPIVRWSASSSIGMIAENQPLQSGRVKTRLALDYAPRFLLQGKTAEGKVLFSKAIGVENERHQEIQTAVTLTPGVEIEGRIEGLPGDYDGSGGVIARVYVRSEGEMNKIEKGYPPSVPWTVWSPVGRDGRFHFTSMPRGMVNLTGLGKGWTTRGPLSVESSTLVNLSGANSKEVVTMQTKPCAPRTAHILLPDGSPAAGAAVQYEWPGINLMAYGRMTMPAEDAEKYAQFKKQPWTATQIVADDQGVVTLENRVTGKTFCRVYWTDPKTQQAHSGTGYYTLEDLTAKTPVEIKVEEK